MVLLADIDFRQGQVEVPKTWRGQRADPVTCQLCYGSVDIRPDDPLFNRRMTNTDVYAAVKDRVNLLSSRGNNDVTKWGSVNYDYGVWVDGFEVACNRLKLERALQLNNGGNDGYLLDIFRYLVPWYEKLVQKGVKLEYLVPKGDCIHFAKFDGSKEIECQPRFYMGYPNGTGEPALHPEFYLRNWSDYSIHYGDSEGFFTLIRPDSRVIGISTK
ncbi:MAG: hypothetical protein GW914_00425 [Candidatus Aenigmarchaeota archaeon]|nr:hypothetical protein [Candidatus Aenigmarchaeota archaeon]